MGRLIDQDRRRQAKADRGRRKESILLAARESLLREPYSSVSLERITRRAREPKGTASMLFGSKQALLMACLREELSAWKERLGSALASVDPPQEKERIADRVAESLLGTEDLGRLFAVFHSVWEEQIEAGEVLPLLDPMAAAIASSGELLERRCRGLAPGEGAAYLWRLLWALGGAHRATHPGLGFGQILALPRLCFAALEYESEVRHLSRSLL